MFNPQHGYELPLSELPVGKSFASTAFIVNAILLAMHLFDSATSIKRAWLTAPTRRAYHLLKIAVRDMCADPRSLLLLSLCTLATIQAGIDVAFAFKSTTKSQWISHYPNHVYTVVSMYTFCFTLLSWCALWRIRALALISHKQLDHHLTTTLSKRSWIYMWWYHLLGKAAVFLGPIATPMAILITLRSLDSQAARPTAALEWRSWAIPTWALVFYSAFAIVPVTLTIASYVSVFGPPSVPPILTRLRSSLRALKTSPAMAPAPAASPSSSPCTSPTPMNYPLLPSTRQDGDSTSRTVIESMRWTYRLLTLMYTVGWIACSLLVGSIMFVFSFVTWVPMLGLVLAFLVLIESQFCKCEEDAVGSGFHVGSDFGVAQSASATHCMPAAFGVIGVGGNDARSGTKEVDEKAVLAVRVLESQAMDT